ncbi:MAG: VOC family protein [Geminicoccaceae bacterium]|nr:VOC family protein [Geminicoccaceae bacterium]
MDGGDRAITGLDHVIVAVADLDAAGAAFGRLGFNASPLGRHEGWGTANHCLMFEDDYVELLGVRDPGLFTNGLVERLEREGEGLLGLVLGSGDAGRTAAAWGAAGIEGVEVRDLARTLDAPDGALRLRFRNAMPPAGGTAGLNLFACEHLTPDLLRRPAWLHHPNGALGIAAVTVQAADPPRVAAALGRLLGASALGRTDRIWTARSGRAAIVVAGADDLEVLHPRLDPPPDGPPRLVALEIAVADLGRTAGFLDLQGVAYARGHHHLRLDAHGLRLEFGDGG